jgi:hypothetical protein
MHRDLLLLNLDNKKLMPIIEGHFRVRIAHRILTVKHLINVSNSSLQRSLQYQHQEPRK